VFVGLLVLGLSAEAQDTTLKKREVSVTSTFKPVLKEAAKINLNASPPTSDTTRPRLQYNIPNQNLQLVFQPGMLKPLALQVDSGGKWNNESYVKAGFGSLSTPFLQAALSVGDGKKMGLNVYARHISSNGKRQYQDFTNTNVEAAAFYQTNKNMEWNARFGSIYETYNKYGFQPSTLRFPEDSLKVKFQTWRGRVSFHNINQTRFGISYAPEIKVDVFNDRMNNSESNTYLNLPVRKTIGRVFEAGIAAEASLTRYKPKAKTEVDNNYFILSPSLMFKTPNLNLLAGIKPSWDNSNFKIFPNVMAELSAPNKQFTIQLGWIGYLRNSGYQYTASLNPWIWSPASVFNTAIEERYAGFKGVVGDHFNYSAKIGLNKFRNQPLFVNDNQSGKSFMVLYEPQMKAMHLGGEIGLTFGERFSLISNLALNNYSGLKVNDKAWGLLRSEFTTKARIQVMKDLYVNGDLFAFDGPWYRTKTGDAKRLNGAMDLGAGLEFSILKNLKVWAQFNNILNKEYQRWNQYPVYGFNLLGGIVFSFAQNNNK
jgi:hypothetical protein